MCSEQGPNRNTAKVHPDDERLVPMRLQRFLARAGVASRRGSEALMTAGRVRVNGEVKTSSAPKSIPLVTPSPSTTSPWFWVSARHISCSTNRQGY